MADPNFIITDGTKSVSMTTGQPISLEDQNWQAFDTAATALSTVAPLASVVASGFTCTITLKDARSFVITLTAQSPPAFQVSTGDNSFTQVEFHALQTVGNTILTLYLANAMTDLTVTYN
jgi:hypothetical protein